MSYMSVNMDAFSHSQVESKKWLCETLYKALYDEIEYDRINDPNLNFWVLGGWQGILPFLMFTIFDTRAAMLDASPHRDVPPRISLLRSFDLDYRGEMIADKINNAYEYDGWRFKAFTEDANELFTNLKPQWGFSMERYPVDVVINTSTEHFEEQLWFENMPEGIYFAVQSTDMDIPDHYQRVFSQKELDHKFPSQRTLFLGEMTFSYPDKTFTRFMKIGEK